MKLFTVINDTIQTVFNLVLAIVNNVALLAVTA